MTIMLFIFFLLIYFSLTFYVAYNGWIWLKKSFGFGFKRTYFLVVFFISISYFLAQFYSISGLLWVGYIWLVVFGYSLLLFPLLNILFFVLKKKRLDTRKRIKWAGFIVSLFYLFVFIYGSYNMWNPVVVSYDIEVAKESELDEIKLLLVSDIHISETIGPKTMTELINLSNEVEPDVILLAGDIIDSSIEPYYSHNLGEIMAGLTAPLGVYAVLGNHEYYGDDIPAFIKEMNEIDIEVLVDEAALIDDLFYVIGRKDYSDFNRLPIDELTKDAHHDKPILLIDHQPREFDKVGAAGVDVMVSGHTHKGQLFPGNLITNAIYENHYGHLQLDDLHTIVSSGYGIWGPPFRIGSRAELVEINVEFN
ncbi:metallophosphoesterase [Alkalihalophilus marmarensis]|jgi:predicted MPP superfamily phosphohydrolase|uniref:Calcineurin-like phosphoesterase domain-containing protein n=1 Tax=Alkalihalophilus marmarensis DSM 21297 TaxID=1188261 RepID=U6SQ00_9BACI|nr:metallophosphoesterase [Alkalihalophilus marmarensis]ERN53432.1 hypothetical protein A33I_11775 [Alkalihalophilus marmarensis DSM 21297]MCM3490829.1 metallophosphoesterase [Alkalihalophilus marmarensis]